MRRRKPASRIEALAGRSEAGNGTRRRQKTPAVGARNQRSVFALSGGRTLEDAMGRYVLLWLLGVPIPILLLIWAFGGLH
jgi:hypothetical protein